MSLFLYYKRASLYLWHWSQCFLTLITLKCFHKVRSVSLTVRSVVIRNVPITVSGAISETLKQNFAASMLLNVAASNFHITHTDTSLGSLARFLQFDVYDFVWAMVRRGAPHLPRTQGSSLNFRWGSPPPWWWCSLCPSSSGGRGRRGTAPAWAHPETAAACQTAGTETEISGEARSSTEAADSNVHDALFKSSGEIYYLASSESAAFI